MPLSNSKSLQIIGNIHVQDIFFFREMIVSMEDHDDKRRLCEPDTWNLQKHLIVDFIQNVLTKVCYEMSLTEFSLEMWP